ncbi:HDOD domain-containing protein [Paraglaciecola sp.]|uniref:HDOD domain-containing protein n=1 Tax=Paraglaciecola sp. TaxID=1920173 RepID=UPI003263080B
MPVVKSDLPDAAKVHAHEKKLKELEYAEIPESFYQFELIQDIDSDTEIDIKNHLQTIRKPHPLLQHLVHNISDPKKLYDVIKTDPELVAKIINVANSPLFGLEKPITNVNHAVIYLGVMQVKNIATHFALQESVAFGDKSQQLAYEKIWSAGFLASSIAQLLAQEMNLDNSAELSTRCQLSYLGDISILFSEPQTAELYLGKVSFFDRIDRIQKLIGTNPSVLAKLLAEQWKLPQEISANIYLGLLPFNNSLAKLGLPERQVKEILLCYISCRLADIISFDHKTDFINSQDLNFEHTQRLEFFHIAEQIENVQFEEINKTFASPKVKNKITELIAGIKEDKSI